MFPKIGARALAEDDPAPPPVSTEQSLPVAAAAKQPEPRRPGGVNALWAIFLLGVSYTGVQLAAALASNSDSLLSDAFSMCVDDFAYAVNLAAEYRPQSERAFKLAAPALSAALLLAVTAWAVASARAELQESCAPLPPYLHRATSPAASRCRRLPPRTQGDGWCGRGGQVPGCGWHVRGGLWRAQPRRRHRYAGRGRAAPPRLLRPRGHQRQRRRGRRGRGRGWGQGEGGGRDHRRDHRRLRTQRAQPVRLAKPRPSRDLSGCAALCTLPLCLPPQLHRMRSSRWPGVVASHTGPCYYPAPATRRRRTSWPTCCARSHRWWSARSSSR